MARVTLIVTALVIALVSVFAGTTAAQTDTRDRTFLTFSGAVEMPGVTLPAGTYVFKLADTPSRNVVEVWDREEKHMRGCGGPCARIGTETTAAASAARSTESRRDRMARSSALLAGGRPPLRRVRLALEVRASRVLAREVLRIAQHDRHGQEVVAVRKRHAIPVLGDGGALTIGRAVAAQPSFAQVRGHDFQCAVRRRRAGARAGA